MVVVRLLGGMGNQMFQYAAARRLAHVLGAECQLDVSSFDVYRRRPYALDAFLVKGEFAKREDVASLNPLLQRGAFGRLSLRIKHRLGLPRGWTVLFENSLRPLNNAVLNASGNVYLAGYWQSEKYFLDIEDTIRDDFRIAHELDENAREVAARIESCESVAVHIRRGEFINDPEASRLHGTCSAAYYQRCFDYLAGRIGRVHLFVFAEDESWARKNLKISFPAEYVPYRPENESWQNMRLMSLCRHHVLANSTFSWWGAWLGQRAGGIVLAPERWVQDDRYDTSDLIPSRWVKIP
jgi:hypothetical protein